jgi:hypothetical protein
MTSKTSAQLKAEATTNYYGINPDNLEIEAVALTRGGILSYWPKGRSASSYRVKGGRGAREEVGRVFRLTDVVAVPAGGDTGPGQPHHPVVEALERVAAKRRALRENAMDLRAARRRLAELLLTASGAGWRGDKHLQENRDDDG